MSTENLIRVTVLAKRNPDLSEAEFHAHWANKHGPLITSWLQKYGVIKYTQVPIYVSIEFFIPLINLVYATRITLVSNSTTQRKHTEGSQTRALRISMVWLISM
jgi:hypothetical protein